MTHRNTISIYSMHSATQLSVIKPYNNYFEQGSLQLSRDTLALSKLKVTQKPMSLFDYSYEPFEIVGYEPHRGIKAPVVI